MTITIFGITFHVYRARKPVEPPKPRCEYRGCALAVDHDGRHHVAVSSL